MSAEMQSYAKGLAVEAIEKSIGVGYMALFIRDSFEKKYGGAWSCIVYNGCKNIGWGIFSTVGQNYTKFNLQGWNFGIYGYHFVTALL